jgi:dUTPase-like protein
MTFEQWIESTLSLQRRAFGIDPPTLQGEDLANYIRWNVLACEDELHEFLQECPIWKPWSKSQVVNTEAAVNELVDALHFIANLLVALGVTGTELGDKYRQKQEVNLMRQLSGYDGVTEKCPGCHRDKDEVGGHVTEYHDGTKNKSIVYCNGCRTEWSNE